MSVREHSTDGDSPEETTEVDTGGSRGGDPGTGASTGAQLLVECLEAEGVEYIFGLPGEQTVPVMDELRDSSIEFVTVRHEQGAAFMADVYGRLTGKPGVCLATLGPGATNLVTGVGNASLDAAPVVALTSQRDQDEQHKHAHQYVDTTAVFDAVTKRTTRVSLARTIPEQVRKAFDIAARETPGATHLEFPEDVTLARATGRPLEPTPMPTSGARPADIERVLDRLEAADHPIILAGNGVLRADGASHLTALAEATGVPVLTSFMGKGAIDARHELSVGTIGFDENDYSMCGLDSADMVLVAGMDYIEYHPEHWNPAGEKELVHVGGEPPEVDAHYEAEVALVGDVGRLLEQLAERADRVPGAGNYTGGLREFVERERTRFADHDGFPVKPQRLVHELRDVLAPEDLVVSDVGAHKYWLSRLYPVYEPDSFIVSNGFASMGIALPGAIAAALVDQRRTVVAGTGDGGFLMNVQELETATRLGVDMTVVIFDDQEYAAITMEQHERYGRTFGSSFENPDIPTLAESFGATGHRVTDTGELGATLREATGNDGVDIVDVPIDPTEATQLSSRLGELVCPT